MVLIMLAHHRGSSSVLLNPKGRCVSACNLLRWRRMTWDLGQNVWSSEKDVRCTQGVQLCYSLFALMYEVVRRMWGRHEVAWLYSFVCTYVLSHLGLWSLAVLFTTDYTHSSTQSCIACNNEDYQISSIPPITKYWWQRQLSSSIAFLARTTTTSTTSHSTRINDDWHPQLP